jgi:cytochrome c oxidase assembly protein subunit 15
MVGGVLFEHGHRLVAAAVGCLMLVLAAWTVVSESRASVRLLALLGLFAVVLQGVLGGVTVLYKLPLAVSVTHACLAQTFFCLTVALAVLTSERWVAARPRADARSGVPVLAAITTGFVFAQLVLGALVRHMGAGLAIPDFPLAFGRLVPPLVSPFITVHFAHRAGALVVALAVASTLGLVVREPRRDPWLRRPALLAGLLVVVQVMLGGLTIWTQRAVVPTTLHLVIGAALLATCLVLTLRAARSLGVLAEAPFEAEVGRQVFA